MLRRLTRVAFVAALAAFGGFALVGGGWAQVCDPNAVTPGPPAGPLEVEPPSVDCSTSGPDPCADANPTIGTVCNDGSLYVGKSSDGNVKMFATRCDAGQVWNGSACVGTGGINWGVQWGAYGVTTDISNTVTGRANSAALASGYSNAWPAKYCDSLMAHGKSDWYLPARNELAVIGTNRTVANISDTLVQTTTTYSSYYWSSTESANGTAWYQRMSDGFLSSAAKYCGFLVRCVRRD